LRKLCPEWDEEESERKVIDSAIAITIEGKPLILPSKEEEQKSELIGAKPKPEKQKGILYGGSHLTESQVRRLKDLVIETKLEQLYPDGAFTDTPTAQIKVPRARQY
jgi:hypothetical protein